MPFWKAKADAKSSNSSSTEDKQTTDHIEDGLEGGDGVAVAMLPTILPKFDWRVLPLTVALYICSYIDRANIGNAKVAGIAIDLGINDTMWRAAVLNSFYIAYIAFEWTQVFWKIFPAHIYVAVLCIIWGAAAMGQGGAHSLAGLVTARVFLGIGEASFGAGAPYYLSFFYPRRRLAFRTGILLGCSPLANCFAGALAYGLTSARTSIHPWRLLLIVEGALTVAMAPIVYFFLPDSPSHCTFLTDAEKENFIRSHHMIDKTKKTSIQWSQFFAGFKDYKSWCHALMHFAANFTFASLSLFLPTIITEFGYSGVHSQGLTAPPYLCAFLCTVSVCWLSDKIGMRGPLIFLFCSIGVTGYALLGFTTTLGVRFFGIFLSSSGVFTSLALNITWLMNNQASTSKRGAGLAVLATLGQTSSFVTTSVFPATGRPYYKTGCGVAMGLTAMMGILALVLDVIFIRENRRRDALHGKPDPDAQIDISKSGEDHPSWRFLL